MYVLMEKVIRASFIVTTYVYRGQIHWPNENNEKNWNWNLPVLGYEIIHTSSDRTSLLIISEQMSWYFFGIITLPGMASMKPFLRWKKLSNFSPIEPRNGLHSILLMAVDSLIIHLNVFQTGLNPILLYVFTWLEKTLNTKMKNRPLCVSLLLSPNENPFVMCYAFVCLATRQMF